jgi:hypothetical protein
MFNDDTRQLRAVLDNMGHLVSSVKEVLEGLSGQGHDIGSAGIDIVGLGECVDEAQECLNEIETPEITTVAQAEEAIREAIRNAPSRVQAPVVIAVVPVTEGKLAEMVRLMGELGIPSEMIDNAVQAAKKEE